MATPLLVRVATLAKRPSCGRAGEWGEQGEEGSWIQIHLTLFGID